MDFEIGKCFLYLYQHFFNYNLTISSENIYAAMFSRMKFPFIFLIHLIFSWKNDITSQTRFALFDYDDESFVNVDFLLILRRSQLVI